MWECQTYSCLKRLMNPTHILCYCPFLIDFKETSVSYQFMISNLKYQPMAQFIYFFPPIHQWLMMQHKPSSTPSSGPTCLPHEHGFTVRKWTKLATVTEILPNVQAGGGWYNPQVQGGNKVERDDNICMGPNILLIIYTTFYI